MIALKTLSAAKTLKNIYFNEIRSYFLSLAKNRSEQSSESMRSSKVISRGAGIKEGGV